MLTLTTILQYCYRSIMRPIIFLIPSEPAHALMVTLGQAVTSLPGATRLGSLLFAPRNPILQQTIHGIDFAGPLGLTAGFDYRGQLPHLLPSLGFGFGTIGTITNQPCSGNPKPQLGRLVKSRSLLVNKGFRNDGIESIIKKFSQAHFSYPIGLSIGRTNTDQHKTLEAAIDDTVAAFTVACTRSNHFKYFELNISCPNLSGNISFYPPENLERLLAAITSLPLAKPLFIKMPISESDDHFLAMLAVIARHPVAGVIIGNLQTDRSHPSLDQDELARYPRGNFSGLPTWSRSNELIRLTHQKYREQLTIIGCGGVFTAQNAYDKILAGASLIQLATGLVYEGPWLPAHINQELTRLLAKDGYTHISQAIGQALEDHDTSAV